MSGAAQKVVALPGARRWTFGWCPFAARRAMSETMRSTPAMRLGLVAARLRRMAVRDSVFYDPARAARDVARFLGGLPDAAGWLELNGGVCCQRFRWFHWRDVLVEVKDRRAVTAAQLARLGGDAAAGRFMGIVLVGPIDPLIADFVMTPDGRRVALVQVALTRGVRP